MKRYTVLDRAGAVVAGLESVGPENALLQRVPWQVALSKLSPGEETKGTLRGELYRLRCDPEETT